MKCVLIGNYGVGNLGDDALREYFLTRFPDIRWTVLSASPHGDHEVPRLPFGLRSLLTTPWWKTVSSIRHCDAVVFGGGSLFTDVESSRACLLWWWHAFVARIFGKPVFLAFQGIGPFRTRMGEWCAKDVISRATFVSVRDGQSRDRASTFARARATVDKGVRIVEAFDPVISLLRHDREPAVGNVLGVIPRLNSGTDFRNLVVASIERDTPQSVRIITMQPDNRDEQALCSSLIATIGSRATLHPVRTLQKLSEEVSVCNRVISARYHGAIAALAAGVPVEIVPQAAGDKLDALRAVKDRTDVDRICALVTEGQEELLKSLNMVK